MIIYKMYQYSVKATLCSALFSVVALLLAGLALVSFTNVEGIVLKILATAVCAAGAVFSFVYLSRQLPDKIAAKDFDNKIRNKPKFAYSYCKQNPDKFDAVAEINPEFAQLYYKDENNKIQKIN